MSAGKGDRNRCDPVKFWESSYWEKDVPTDHGSQITDDSSPFDKRGAVHGDSEQCGDQGDSGGFHTGGAGGAAEGGDDGDPEQSTTGGDHGD